MDDGSPPCSPHIPTFKGQENFNGQIIHPQFWSEEIDYTNKKIAVIGSGATAITLVPAIAQDAKHVVMIQRSPTYVVSRPSEDSINKVLKKFLPINLTYFLVRWKNILWQSYTFFLARTFPQKIKTTIINLIKEELGNDWMDASLFRFGASSLLGDIERQLEHYLTGNYSANYRHPLG